METNMTKKKLKGIQRAIICAKSIEGLGRALGVTKDAVRKWEQKGYVPRYRVALITELYGIPPEELCNPRLLQEDD